MKIDNVYFIIAIAAGLLISYGLWSLAGELASFIAFGSAIFLCSTLGLMFGIRHENPRVRFNLSTLSGVFFLIGLVINVVFCFTGNIPVPYILVSGLTFLSFLLLINFIQNARQ